MNWAKDVGFRTREAQKIAEGDQGVDDNPETSPMGIIADTKKLEWHFDMSYWNGESRDTRMRHYEEETDSAIQSVKKRGRTNSALFQFGQGLHPYQDIDAHMDWQPQTDLGIAPNPHMTRDETTLELGVREALGDDYSYASKFDNPNYEITKGSDWLPQNWRYTATKNTKDREIFGLKSTRYEDTKRKTKEALAHFYSIEKLSDQEKPDSPDIRPMELPDFSKVKKIMA